MLWDVNSGTSVRDCMGWWRDWMLEAWLEAISMSLLNRDNENQNGDTQNTKEGKN